MTGRYALNKNYQLNILVVEDNETMRRAMVQILKKVGRVAEAAGGIEALNQIKEDCPDLVITDYKMTGLNGLDLMKKIKSEHSDIEIMIITAFGSIELAVEAMKAGARDFITKPFSKEEILLKVNRAADIIQQRIRSNRLADENRYLREEVDVRLNYGDIIGQSAPMKKIFRTVRKMAASDASVLITGESGTGKELVARAIHNQSARSSGPFIRVNCGALAEGVLESELFGHEKGAFTGALRCKKGRFELADHGTLFLDEIGDVPLTTQVKLLRVLQEKEFERVGGEETLSVDVRVLAATHRNLKEELKKGTFREDLFYRLFILPVEIPPLRERKDDIPVLTDYFITRICDEMQKERFDITPEAMKILIGYNWPGNVRELENVLERAVVLSADRTLRESDFSFLISSGDAENASGTLDLNINLESLEHRLLKRAMKESKGVKARAARLLGIKEGAFYYKLKKYGLLEDD